MQQGARPRRARQRAKPGQVHKENLCRRLPDTVPQEFSSQWTTWLCQLCSFLGVYSRIFFWRGSNIGKLSKHCTYSALHKTKTVSLPPQKHEPKWILLGRGNASRTRLLECRRNLNRLVLDNTYPLLPLSAQCSCIIFVVVITNTFRTIQTVTDKQTPRASQVTHSIIREAKEERGGLLLFYVLLSRRRNKCNEQDGDEKWMQVVPFVCPQM